LFVKVKPFGHWVTKKDTDLVSHDTICIDPYALGGAAATNPEGSSKEQQPRIQDVEDALEQVCDMGLDAEVEPGLNVLQLFWPAQHPNTLIGWCWHCHLAECMISAGSAQTL